MASLSSCEVEVFAVEVISSEKWFLWEVVQKQMWLYRPVLWRLDVIISYIQDLVMVGVIRFDLKMKEVCLRSPRNSREEMMDEVQTVYLQGSHPIRTVSRTARLFSRTDPLSAMLTYIHSSAM